MRQKLDANAKKLPFKIPEIVIKKHYLTQLVTGDK